MLTAAGIQPFEYERVTHNFNDFALLDSENPVDVMSAYLSDQPFLYQEQGYSVQIINPANYGVDFYGDLIYTSEAYLKQNTDRVIAFKEASLKGWRYAMENTDEVISWLSQTYPSGKSTASLEYEAGVISQMIAMNFVALGTTYPARFQRIATIYQQLDMGPSNSNIDGLTLDEYVKKVQAFSERTRRVIMIVLGLALVIIGLMFLGIRSLQSTIKNRTQALQRQLEVTDKYVISTEIDRDDQYISVSTAFCEALGYSQQELLSQNPEHMVPEKLRPARREIVNQVLSGTSWQGEMQLLSKSGDVVWIQLYIDPLRNSAETIDGYTATAADITERKLVEKMSETDALTGVANRKKLDAVMSKEWARYIRYQHELSLIIFDLDNFKKINDEFGHLEGDKVLVAVADLVSESIRATDTFGRWGGEEFMVILPETSLHEAQLVAEKLREAVSQLNVLGSKSITASFGVAGVLEGITELETLIRLSDEGLYVAKENGRNRVEIVD
jgi:diguanylate cyclase (GGDEF)-like protein/PAS domain S-box-containing protein